ncbi:FAD-binding oxidoreductase [Phaeobacter sp.]|uniref:NAD(P)/FAD-dependent oxidoreductase n=1 Tax=Phaeobacter sp. TaxID=1902409 RepID=UPI0025F61AF5|nr:FAD-binding oxidoreductase [Phaeobacter sp.]
MTDNLDAALWARTNLETVIAPPLTTTETADLLIIGGGYTGCSAALTAAQTGADVRLLEAATFGAGGSGRNVGLVNAGLWLPPNDIQKHLGAAAADKLINTLAQAPSRVFEIIEDYQINCEATRAGTLHCAHAPSGMADLENRYAQLERTGAPVALLSKADAQERVGSAQVHGALFDPRAGTIQPLAYATGLARAAHASGAKLHSQSPVVSLHKNASKGIWRAITPNGEIRAKKLIMATNAYPLPIDGYSAPATIPVHYFQAATAPLPSGLLDRILPSSEGCWDTGLVMSSWRKDRAGRLIIGAMGQLGHLGSAVHSGWLRRKLARMFPDLADQPFETQWHGRIAMTHEHIPKILDLGDGYACFGYSGRGIGPGTVFGSAMADALLRNDSSDLPVSPVTSHSLPFSKLRGAYYESGATLVHLLKDR